MVNEIDLPIELQDLDLVFFLLLDRRSSVFFYLFKQNKFQLKVGTFAQKKSPSTLLVENCLANWHISSRVSH